MDSGSSLRQHEDVETAFDFTGLATSKYTFNGMLT
jgi:hypothetical protein